MPSHRRRRPLKPVVVAVILVAVSGLTIRAVEQLGEPAAEAAADTSGTTASDAASPSASLSLSPSPSPTSTPVKAVTGLRTDKSSSYRTRAQAPSSDTIPKSVCQPNRVDETITVLTYNIAAGQFGLAGVLGEIAASDADVVLLQEVDRFQARSGNIDMPTYLSEQLGMKAAFGANLSAGGGSEHGTAILSRYPIEEEWNALLPNPLGDEPRGLLHVVLNVQGLRLSVYGTQLDQDNRRAQVEQISAIKSIVAKDPMPKLLGGDLSSQPGSPVVRIALSVLDDAWATGVGAGSPLTSPAARPRWRNDYLLHAGVALEPRRAAVLSTGASDHRAVRASYRLRGNAGSVCHDEPRAGKRR